MQGLSKTQIAAIANLEFKQKYYFTKEDIKEYFKNKRQLVNTIYSLRKKGRIVRINRNKYFLVPIRAKIGKWTDHPFIIADEICDGKDYYIGGWQAANFWRLTDQIPMQADIYTTRRQGKKNMLNTRFVFHRTSKKSLKKAVTKQIDKHSFQILNRNEAKKWMKSRE